MLYRTKRIPHIMKTQLKTTCPSNLLFFDTETTAKRINKELKEEFHYLWFGFANAFRLEDGNKTREQWLRFTDNSQFWKFVDSRLDKNRPLYLFAHKLSFDLTIVDFWNEAMKQDWYIDFFVLDDPPMIVGVTTPKGKMYFIDTLNYWRMPLAVLGESLKFPKLSMPEKRSSKKVWDKYCKQDVAILAKAVTGLMDFLRENELGSFGLTAPSIAMNTYKRRFMSKQLFIHDRYNICEIERESYYGGMVECFFIGNVRNQTIYNYDVNSLYPYVMLNEFPVKIKGDTKDIGIKMAGHLMEEYACVATVTLNTNDETYPKRVDHKLCMVRGHFQTAICGPELRRAFNNRHIQRIHHFVWYEKARIFDEYVKYFWEARKQFKAEGNEMYDTFCKLMMNSLYGKFAQRSYQWMDYTPQVLRSLYQHFNLEFPKRYENKDIKPSVEWGTEKVTLLGFDFPISFRKYHNKIQICFPLSEHPESFPLISAYVTSYGREYLRKLIKDAGPRNTYYCDTDSLFVNAKGKKLLELNGHIQPKLLGGLKLVGESNNTTFYCPKDYLFADKETRKGIKKNATDLGNNTFEMLQFEGIKSVLNRTPEPFIKISTVTKTNARKYTKGEVQADGWTTPFDFAQNQQVILF